MIMKNRFYVGCDDGSGHTRLSPSPGQLGMVVVVVVVAVCSLQVNN